MNIIMLGPPGVGKGTQAIRLQRELGLPHVASGDIFRAIRREETPLALEVQSYMDAGEYVPDDPTIELVLARLRRPDTEQGFILDGFPRTIIQGEALTRELAADDRHIDTVIFITAPFDILQARLQGRIICPQCHAIYNLATNPPKNNLTCDICGHDLERRTDESPDVVKTRIEVYLRETKPLVEFYRSQGVLVEIDGSRGIAEVSADVDRALRTGEKV
jgi:adenylate kinase